MTKDEISKIVVGRDISQGFQIIQADDLEIVHKKIEEILKDDTVLTVITFPLVLPVGGKYIAYKNTPINIRFWVMMNFANMNKEPRYDIAVKLIR